MDQHVNFSDDQAVVHNDSELLPVFVQDTDDYPTDGNLGIPDIAYGRPDVEDESKDCEVHDFEDCY